MNVQVASELLMIVKEFFRNLKRATDQLPPFHSTDLQSSLIDIFQYLLEQFPIDVLKLGEFSRGCSSSESVKQFLKENSLEFLKWNNISSEEIMSPFPSTIQIPSKSPESQKEFSYISQNLISSIPQPIELDRIKGTDLSLVKSNSSFLQVVSPSHTTQQPSQRQMKPLDAFLSEVNYSKTQKSSQKYPYTSAGSNIYPQRPNNDTLLTTAFLQELNQRSKSTSTEQHGHQFPAQTNQKYKSSASLNSLSSLLQNQPDQTQVPISFKSFQIFLPSDNISSRPLQETSPFRKGDEQILSQNYKDTQISKDLNFNQQQSLLFPNVKSRFQSIQLNSGQLSTNKADTQLTFYSNPYSQSKECDKGEVIPKPPFNPKNLLNEVRQQITTMNSHTKMYNELTREFNENQNSNKENNQSIVDSHVIRSNSIDRQGSFVLDLFKQMKKSLKNVVVYAHKDQRKASMFQIEKDLQVQRNQLNESIAQYQIKIKSENYQPSKKPQNIVVDKNKYPHLASGASSITGGTFSQNPSVSSQRILAINNNLKPLQHLSRNNYSYKSPSDNRSNKFSYTSSEDFSPQVNHFSSQSNSGGNNVNQNSQQDFRLSSLAETNTWKARQPFEFLSPQNQSANNSSNILLNSFSINKVQEITKFNETTIQQSNYQVKTIPNYESYFPLLGKNNQTQFIAQYQQPQKHLYIEDRKIY